ncbi:MAG: tryptophan--tRNA ligase [Spirochaetaceae bacterium 4572_59]|nr:MAG: tryptophan--tRNA ligase [Spirochaetaceae bacterium 4572_59]
MSKEIALTGIKPTGMPHLGNYLGAIKPALALAESYEARFFIADYHSLNTIKNPEDLRNYTYEIAACWLACGLDPEKVLIYRQSDVPETFELTTMIMAFTSKGLMNRAHAYKAQVDQNRAKGKPEDHNVNMGLFTYPVLMAADILLFDANYVPVGKDQVQHIEMAVDIAQAVNRNYKQELLTLPKPFVSESTQVVIGSDGRKMSKSYDNTIPLFIPEKKLKKLCNKIITNSQTVEEPKDPDNCNVFTLYKLFATDAQQAALAARYRAGGMGWGEAKAELFNVLNAKISPMRERYNELMADKSSIDKILSDGGVKARELAAAKIKSLRKVMGFDFL